MRIQDWIDDQDRIWNAHMSPEEWEAVDVERIIARLRLCVDALDHVTAAFRPLHHHDGCASMWAEVPCDCLVGAVEAALADVEAP